MVRLINFRKTISFLILISTIFFISGIRAMSQPPIQPPGLDIAMEVQEAHTATLMEDPDIVGTAVGLNDDGEPVIKVFANTGKARGIPSSIEGIPVVAEVTGPFIARSDPTAWFPRPVPIGVSTGHPDITAGTIGCRVTDGTDVYALSNNHVYAVQNNASIGDSVIQPGAYDGGTLPEDFLGTLFDFQPINFSGGNNTIDAAIASTAYLGISTPSDGYGTPGSEIFGDNNHDGFFDNKNDLLNLNVQKFGRTTKLTHGTITGINATVNVCYASSGPFCTKLATFVDQLVITPGGFSAGGDSGSLIAAEGGADDKKPVGLLFAGSSTQTIANRIDLVFDRFGVTCDNGAEALCANDADCNDGNACTTDSCNTATGSCSNAPISCNDGNTCTTDSCNPATGCGNAPITCNDGSTCTDDSCNPSAGCVFVDNRTCAAFCSPKAASCSNNAECCSNKCTGRSGRKTCK